jgi:cytochrome c-type biogenesis protein CcmH
MTPAFWMGAAALVLLALAFLVVPWWQERRQSGRTAPSALVSALAIAPVAVGLYLAVTTYDPAANVPAAAASAEEMALLEQLAARLGENPDDIEGWMLLGRLYRSLQDYESARLAFAEAWQRTAMPEDLLKLYYAEAMLLSDPRTAAGMAGDLLDDVLESAPDNPNALWLGGIASAERGNSAEAAERFTALLATNPPPEIATIVREQIARLTGSPVSVPADVAPAGGPVIDVEIRVADGMLPETLGPNSYVYLFARGGAGGPPIAARQIAIEDLPGHFELSDANAMMPGRTLAGQGTVTVVARISVNGQPIAEAGDVYGEVEVDPESGETVSVTIDQVVPSV